MFKSVSLKIDQTKYTTPDSISMEDLASQHRKSYVYYQGIPLQTWWYSQKKLWFSHCDMNIEDFEKKENTTDSAQTICENFVIWWDQILRHPIDHPDTITREQRYVDVFIIAKELYDKMDNEIAQIFMLLAIRHSNNVNHKKFVCDYVRDRITNNLDEKKPISSIWFRFWKASLEDYMNLNVNVLTYTNCKSIHDDPVSLPTTYTSAPIDIPDYLTQPVYLEFCEQMKHVKPIPVLTVSLSGGVDSMVLAYCASKWCRIFKIPLSLLHIQYNNRPETEKEIQFLKEWIGKTLPYVPFYIRSITELRRRRESKWRTVYEDITRQYRFQAYSMLGGHILLGHNYDDTIENILTNITSQTHYENMKGMKVQTQYHDVTLYRPFLNIRKQDIYQFAESFHIPHLPDSTPEWSRRGMLRDHVIPALYKFDKNLISGFTALSHKMGVYHSMYVKSIVYWIQTNIVQKQQYLFTMDTHKSRIHVHTTMYYSIPYDEEFIHQMEFWDIFFDHFRLRCSTKSKENFLQVLTSTNMNHRFTLTSTLHAFIDNRIHIFQPTE